MLFDDVQMNKYETMLNIFEIPKVENETVVEEVKVD